MPRSTKHLKCVRCPRPPRMGVYLSFYGLRPKNAAKEYKQTNVSLPSQGFCEECFFQFAEAQGFIINRAEVRKKLAHSEPGSANSKISLSKVSRTELEGPHAEKEKTRTAERQADRTAARAAGQQEFGRDDWRSSRKKTKRRDR